MDLLELVLVVVLRKSPAELLVAVLVVVALQRSFEAPAELLSATVAAVLVVHVVLDVSLPGAAALQEHRQLEPAASETPASSAGEDSKPGAPSPARAAAAVSVSGCATLPLDP